MKDVSMLEVMTKEELVHYVLELHADMQVKERIFDTVNSELEKVNTKYENLKNLIKSVIVVID